VSCVPSVPNPLIVRRAEFQRALLDWYRANARALPWREAPSVYKTVVSEFMLQQTQVKTVLPYFARWLAELPDFAILAAASEERVLKLWEGLGYYSRARNLHKLAKALAARTNANTSGLQVNPSGANPNLPRTPAEWRELPGVGPYTAAAVTSISFGEPAACVDGNVVRILARLTANVTEFADSATAAKVFTPLAQALLPSTGPGDHNQAMMELGATVCLRQNPRCLTCPVRAFCAAAKRGDPENYPRLTPKKFEHRAVTRVWCVHENAVLLQRAAAGAKRLAELHELPTGESIGLDSRQLARSKLLATRKRSITRFQITESIHVVTFTPAQRRSLTGRPSLHWIPLGELDRVTLSGPHRRWITELLREVNGGGVIPPRIPRSTANATG
jgi:A/G-specific adenine glycosylase